MRIVVISDSHRKYATVEKIIKAQPDAHHIFFLGDLTSDIEDLVYEYSDKNFYIVSGNCDFNSSYSYSNIAKIGDTSIFFATVCARIISSFLNYLMNRNAVFKNVDRGKKTDKKTLVKYYILVVVQMCVSSVLVFGIHKVTLINETIVKIPVDVFIFMVNYFVQKVIEQY